MWPDTRALALLGIDHPIVLAPMASATNAELVATVSEAGGLGSYGAAGTPPDSLRQVIHAIRERTDRPFNINLFAADTEQFDRHARPGPRLATLLQDYHAGQGLAAVPPPDSMFGPAEEQLQVLLEEKVPVISYHFGVGGDTVSRAKANGAVVLCSATTVDEAIALQAAGVDAIIAQGAEAGGHRGTFTVDYSQALIGTLALVPQIVDAVSVPVIAAGGIMDARGIVACHALGASAAQLGTAFLGCPDAPISAEWRDQLLSADASQTTVTKALSGKPARGLRNRYVTEVENLDEPLLPYPAQYSVSRDLRKKALADGNTDFQAMWSGQGVGLLQNKPAAELVASLVADSQALMKQFAGS